MTREENKERRRQRVHAPRTTSGATRVVISTSSSSSIHTSCAVSYKYYACTRCYLATIQRLLATYASESRHLVVEWEPLLPPQP
jgi:hypothetical protein